jgi:hypothetical protein
MQTNKMIKITIYSILLLVIPILLQAQYMGGNGRGDASISLTNAHISVHKIEKELPTNYELYQNYPNPFNPSTNIKYQITNNKYQITNNDVTLKVFDILGKEIATLVNEKQSPGEYEVIFEGSQYPSGIYFYKLITGDFTETRKMLMIK